MSQASMILALAIFVVAVNVPFPARATTMVNLQGPQLEECVAPSARICVEDACSCLAPTKPGEAAKPRAQCTVTVGYAGDRPDAPWLQFSDGDCAMNADVALAVSLASLLKMSMPATPAPKP